MISKIRYLKVGKFENLIIGKFRGFEIRKFDNSGMWRNRKVGNLEKFGKLTVRQFRNMRD